MTKEDKKFVVDVVYYAVSLLLMYTGGGVMRWCDDEARVKAEFAKMTEER